MENLILFKDTYTDGHYWVSTPKYTPFYRPHLSKLPSNHPHTILEEYHNVCYRACSRMSVVHWIRSILFAKRFCDVLPHSDPEMVSKKKNTVYLCKVQFCTEETIGKKIKKIISDTIISHHIIVFLLYTLCIFYITFSICELVPNK